MDEIINKLNEAYTRLQTLDIQPTQKNMEKLLQCLYDLKEAARMITEAEKDGKDGQAAGPG